MNTQQFFFKGGLDEVEKLLKEYSDLLNRPEPRLLKVVDQSKTNLANASRDKFRKQQIARATFEYAIQLMNTDSAKKNIEVLVLVDEQA